MKTEENKPYIPKAFPNDYNSEDGMDLRDYFAAKAMQSVIVGSTYENYTGNNGMPIPDFVAKESYKIADAMLKQREL